MKTSRFDALARRLRAWGLSDLAAALLEGAGPFALVGAQALYFTGGALAPFVEGEEITALAQMLEDPAQLHALAQRLTGEHTA